MHHKVKARVYTIRMRIGGIWGDVFRELPEFYVEAENAGKAEKKARQIIDPLQMTGAEITTVSIRRFGRKNRRKS